MCSLADFTLIKSQRDYKPTDGNIMNSNIMVDPNQIRLNSVKDSVVSTARKYVSKARNFREFCLERSRQTRGAKSAILQKANSIQNTKSEVQNATKALSNTKPSVQKENPLISDPLEESSSDDNQNWQNSNLNLVCFPSQAQFPRHLTLHIRLTHLISVILSILITLSRHITRHSPIMYVHLNMYLSLSMHPRLNIPHNIMHIKRTLTEVLPSS